MDAGRGERRIVDGVLDRGFEDVYLSLPRCRWDVCAPVSGIFSLWVVSRWLRGY